MIKRHLLYLLPIVLLLITAVAGWFATDYLGNKGRQEMVAEGQAGTLALSIHVSSTFTYLERAVKALAGSPLLSPALLSNGIQDIEHADSVLDRLKLALNASVTYLMDTDGMVVASSNRNDPNNNVGKSYCFSPYFQEAAKGHPARYFALGITTEKRGFYVSHPVRNSTGKVLGVVAMKKNLDDIEALFSRYASSFLVSPDGIILLSSKPAMVLKSLWPLDKAAQEKLIASRQFGNKLFGNGLFNKEITDGMGVTLEGEDYFVSRKVIDNAGWSIVHLTPTDRIGAHKLIAILATVSACFFIVFLSGIILVTDRSKEAIRQSEEKHKLLFDSAGDAIFVFDKEGRVLAAVNPLACERLGYTHAELMSMTMDQLYSPEESLLFPDLLAGLTEQGLLTNETVRQRKDGSLFPIDVIARRITWDGQPAFMSTCRDITERKLAEEALRESDDRHTAMTANIGDVIGIMGSDGIMKYKSPNIERWFGWKPEDLVGTDGWETVHSEDIERIQKEFNALLEKDNVSTTVEYRYKCKDGSYKWIELTAVNCVNDPAINGVLLNYHAVTARKQAEQALRKSEEKYRTLFEQSNDAIIIHDLSGQILEVNQRTSEMLGYDHEQFYRMTIPMLHPKTEFGASEKAFQETRSEGYTLFESQFEREDGTLIDVEISSSIIDKANGIVQGIFRDITARKQAEEQIQQMAYHDSLTGFPNRELFSDRLGIALTQAQRNKKEVGIAMLDLDNFKDVNDTLGHAMGDLLLKAAAERLSAALRKGDTVARFGGDEFVLILPDLKAVEDAVKVAHKIVDGFRKPFLIDTHQLVVTTSIGIAVYPNHGTDEGALLKNADIAMYQAKEAGRDRYQFYIKA